MEGAGTCKRLCFHCCCCSTGWLQWDESTAMDWKGNNPGPKGQVGKEGPRHGAAWDRDSEQEPGWLWPPCISGHKEWSCQREKHFHDLLHSAQLQAECPRQAGSKRCQALTISQPCPRLGFGGEHGNRESHWAPLASWGTASSGPSLAPAGKWHCHIWMCHHEPGNCQGSAGRGGHSSGVAEKAAQPQQARKEGKEERLQMGEDAETTPGALAQAFCSKNRLVSFISSTTALLPIQACSSSPHKSSLTPQISSS